MPSSSISVEQPRRGREPGEKKECNSKPAAAAAADADVGNQVKSSHSSSSPSSSSLESEMSPPSSMIPVILPGALNLNAPATLYVAGQPPAGERRPVVCVPCGAAFYFSDYEIRVLCAIPPWYVFPPPPAAAASAFVTQAVVASMRAGGGAAAPVPLPVCSNPDHFLLAVGALQPRELADLGFKSPAALGVVPLDVRRDERAPVNRLCRSSKPPATMPSQPPPRQVVSEVAGSSEMPPEHDPWSSSSCVHRAGSA
ncbi:hypothetical protein ACP4OV_000177 [Aristida adscensionis]